jgi:NADP-dependent 3-hydroxy acid dehydrogenase YdfG
MESFEGKTAFITGGGSGIGFGIAKVFAAKAGMNVVLADLRQEALDEAITWFRERDLPAHPIQLDVTDREAYAKAADEAETKFGKIHVLINNAGVGPGVKLQDATYNDWDFGMGVNVGGVINGLVTILPRILKHGEEGHVVSTSSTNGLFSIPGFGIYTTSKYAVSAMMEVLYMDLKGTNVTASVYFPGPVKTNLPVTTVTTRPEKYKNENEPKTPPPPPPPPGDAPKIDPDRVVMDPVEVGYRILRGIKRKDIFIMSHPVYGEGIITRHKALLRSIPDEPRDHERDEVLRSFGALVNNPVYEEQTTPGAPDWDLSEEL